MTDILVKTLSANEIGITGSHQAGIVVPRDREALAFFPALSPSIYNPRAVVSLLDVETGDAITLNFIYYNGKLHGGSTRNEYRLTGLSRYLRERSAVPGDALEFRREGDQYTIRFLRKGQAVAMSVDPDTIILSGTWKTIKKGR